MRALLLLSAVFLAACANCSSGKTEPAPVVREQPGKDLCPLSCEAMASKLTNSDGGVGCEEAVPAPSAPDAGDTACFDGGPPHDCVSCVALCIASHENGSFWNTECIAKRIKTCEEIETVCNTQ